MKARTVGWSLLAGALACGACAAAALVVLRRGAPAPRPVQEPARQRALTAFEVSETIFDGGFGPGWTDWGWGPHEFKEREAGRVRFGDYGGIILHHDVVSRPFGALVFRFRAPPEFGEFLEVALQYEQLGDDVFPRVPVGTRESARLDGGFQEALIPWNALNPSGGPFDRIVIRARRPVGSEWVSLDKIVLTRPPPNQVAPPAPAVEAKLAIDCTRDGSRISPLIYGISNESWASGGAARRVGGNTMSRFNWDLGVWNTGSDWFFENVAIPTSVAWWVADDLAHGVKTALVVPMIGWVAKDAQSVGFPVSRFGAQRGSDKNRPEAGDGVRPDGKPITPGPPMQTSIPAPPDRIGRWVSDLVAKDRAKGVRSVDTYILDNEPTLWNVTHRDVHPSPLTYDELLERTIGYGGAIRQADPGATIAGPAEWGWTGYFFSAKDTAEGVLRQPDRRAHGGVPLLPWYLHKLAEHERRTGVRVLDLVDVHFYPQGQGLYGSAAGTDVETAARRLRATRALWDPTYEDESWIKEHVKLIPRLKEWIEQNYPGRGISIGEWSFGAEGHISGGLAVAEALGRLGQQGVASAYFWGSLASGSPAFLAFRAYRNFDGKGGRFLDWSLPTEEAPDVSLFASRDDPSTKVVAIVVNRDPAHTASAKIELRGCGHVHAERVFQYGAGAQGLTESGPGGSPDRVVLPPYSMGVVEYSVSKP